MGWTHPTGKAPLSVAIVGLGPSKKDFVKDASRHTPDHPVDEVWVVNTGMRWCKHDVAFVMDDMAQFARHFPEYGEVLRTSETPIITSSVYTEFPRAVGYPLNAIYEKFKQTYFNNSVPYIIAYALFIGVKHLVIYGCDYTHPGTIAREDGRGCTEFWVGYAAAFGMQIEICQSSTLMDAHTGVRFYGYIAQPIMRAQDTSLIDPDNVVRYYPPKTA